MKALSKRLQVIFNLINDGAKVADIGTDHAYLPIALSLSGKCKSIIAADIKEKPLNKARENIEKIGTLNIETRLSNGLTEINYGEADTIVVAGMGGDVISGIIDGCSWVKNEKITLLLQPMTSAEILREYLLNNAFGIISETAISEQGKVYTVIEARYNKKKISYEDGFLFTGKITPDTTDGRLYLEKQSKRVSVLLNDLIKLDNKEEEKAKYTAIKEYIDLLLEIN